MCLFTQTSLRIDCFRRFECIKVKEIHIIIFLSRFKLTTFHLQGKSVFSAFPTALSQVKCEIDDTLKGCLPSTDITFS